MSGARFVLELDLRAAEAEPERGAAPRGTAGRAPPAETPFLGAGAKPPPEVGDVAPERVEAARARIDQTFKAQPPRLDPDALMKGLEQDLGLARDALPLATLRTLGEHLLERIEERGASGEHEARWLNLVGFCLRPGFGVPLDDWRVRQLWRVHAQGPIFGNHAPSELNWWILWRRVAGGLTRGHQEELASRVFPMIVPALAKRARKKPPRPDSQEAAEMWRAAASLEQLGVKARVQLGEALLGLLEERRGPRGALWCLGRLGARRLLYGPREATVRPETAYAWAERLLALKKLPKDEDFLACLLALGRLTGDRQLDLAEEQRKALVRELGARGTREAQLLPFLELTEVDQAAQGAAFGEGLPVGLSLS